MKVITPNTDTSSQIKDCFNPNDPNVKLFGSCGAPLIKVDDDTYRCNGLGCRFSLKDTEVIIDKCGNKFYKLPPSVMIENENI